MAGGRLSSTVSQSSALAQRTLPDGQLAAGGSSEIGWDGLGIYAGQLIDCEEDRTLRAVLIGMLRETERK